MRKLHRTLMIILPAAVLAVGAVVVQPWGFAAHAQHGEFDDPQAHFEEIAQRLELSTAQRDTLSDAFYQAFSLMEEFHRLHEEIAAELTTEQQQKLGHMMHEAMGGSVLHQRHGESHHRGIHH